MCVGEDCCSVSVSSRGVLVSVNKSDYNESVCSGTASMWVCMNVINTT